jgi:hypothetical protein
VAENFLLKMAFSEAFSDKTSLTGLANTLEQTIASEEIIREIVAN